MQRVILMHRVVRLVRDTVVKNCKYHTYGCTVMHSAAGCKSEILWSKYHTYGCTVLHWCKSIFASLMLMQSLHTPKPQFLLLFTIVQNVMISLYLEAKYEKTHFYSIHLFFFHIMAESIWWIRGNCVICDKHLS